MPEPEAGAEAEAFGVWEPTPRCSAKETHMEPSMREWHHTTVIAVRRGGTVAVEVGTVR